MLTSLLLKLSFYWMFGSMWCFSNCCLLLASVTVLSISSCFSSGSFLASSSSAKWETFFTFFFYFLKCSLFAFLSLYLFPRFSLHWSLPFFHLKVCLWALGSHIRLPIRHLHLDISQKLQDQHSYNYILFPPLLSNLLNFLWYWTQWLFPLSI